MPIPIPLPLAPLAGAGASAAASTFIAGSSLKLAQSLYGFQRSIPTLPPLTGLEGVATLQDLISDALAGARVPVASLPNPLGPNGSLAGAIAAAAAVGMWAEREKIKNGLLELGKLLGIQNANTAQRWGLLGGPNITGRDGPRVTSSGNWNPNGQNLIRWSGYWVGNDYLGRPVRTNGLTNSGTTVTGPFGVRIKTGNSYEASLCYSATEIFCGYYPPGGLVDNRPINWTGFMGSFTFTVLSGGPGYPVPSDAVTGNPPIELVPWLGAPSFDDDSFVTAELPQAISLPQATQNSQPFTDSSADIAQGAQQVVPVQPGPQTPAVPSVASPVPSTLPPWLLPGANPTTQSTTNDGQLSPTAKSPVMPTPADSVTPWPGAAPIPGAGVAPAPTLQGIAVEVGRIERKLEIMMNPASPGNLLDKFGDLKDFIGPLIELISATTAGTTYTLDSPCEVDDDGNRLPAVAVAAAGGFTQFGAILNRLDALAALIQVHKDLKQPNCKQKPPTGEFVTVNFEQID